MTDIQWVDAPPDCPRSKPRTGKWKVVIAELKQRPGQWALIDVGCNRHVASNLKRGITGGVQPGEIEAVTRHTRTNESGAIVCDVYARYVGNGAS